MNRALPPLRLQPLAPADIDAVLGIQALCYDRAKQESAASFLSKLAASPRTSFLALLGQTAVGYLVSVPVGACEPLALHDTGHVAPERPVALYLHDLAIHPDARGVGAAAALVDAFFGALAASGLRSACLTAVNGSSPFWQRHGFAQLALTGPASARLAGYGAGARFMACMLPGPPAG